VTDAIERSAAVSIENVDVRVRDGVVMLSGIVSDRVAVDAAFDAARYTRGVVNVENFLTVEGEEGE
jgi:osmotically-inducible protein OsmY